MNYVPCQVTATHITFEIAFLALPFNFGKCNKHYWNIARCQLIPLGLLQKWHIYRNTHLYLCMFAHCVPLSLASPDISLSLLCMQHCATYWLSKCVDLLIYLYRNRIAFSCSPFHPSYAFIFAFYICDCIFHFSPLCVHIWDLWLFFICVKVRILQCFKQSACL